MFPNRPRIKVPVIVRKNGEMFIPKFPVELSEGDQLIICQELRGWQAPKVTVLNGYTDNGPVKAKD